MNDQCVVYARFSFPPHPYLIAQYTILVGFLNFSDQNPLNSCRETWFFGAASLQGAPQNSKLSTLTGLEKTQVNFPM